MRRLGVPVVTALCQRLQRNRRRRHGARRRACKADHQGDRHAAASARRASAWSTCATRAFITANAAFDEPDLPVGRIFAASHSRRHDRHVSLARQGARHSALPGWSRSATRSISRSARFARRRSTIPASTATCCFSKPCARPRRCAPSRSKLRSAASRCWPTSSAARLRRASLRVSHTGALAGEDDIAGMFLAECGIARVDYAGGPDRGLSAAGARAHARARRAAAGALRWSRQQRGGATMVVDPLSVRGIEVRQPTPQTLARLKEHDRRRRRARAARST